MKHFSDIMSPSSWLILHVGFTPLYFVLFSPSVLEFAVYCVVEVLALIATREIDKKLFIWLFPDCAAYFPEANPEKIAATCTEERIGIFQSMARFPARRSLYCALMSFVKCFPGMLVVVFYWQHEGSYLMQWFKLQLAEFFVWSFFYGAVFIENHGLVSKKLSELHSRFDFSEVFRRVDVPKALEISMTPEKIAMFFIWFFALGLQLILLQNNAGSGSAVQLQSQLGSVAVSCLLLASRLWYLGRYHVTSGLSFILEAMEGIDPDGDDKILPLPPSPVFASFAKSFNGLIERVRSYRMELLR